MADATAPVSKSKLKQMIWPEPLVVPPTATHTHSFIILHGRGSNARRFGLQLLREKTSDGLTLAEHFPSAKFVFPTAKKRRAVLFNRTPINQWFDHESLDNPSQRADIQCDGLRETSAFMHSLIMQEAHLVGLSQVVIGGLSQGCAASLHVLLNFQPPAASDHFLGFIGMCGWLPFADALDDAAQDFGEDDIFSTGNRESGDITQRQLCVANTARDIASLPPFNLTGDEKPAFTRTPIFLGHGVHDDRVSMQLGERARDVLSKAGCAADWKTYDEGHWYKVPDQLDDIVAWLKHRASAQ